MNKQKTVKEQIVELKKRIEELKKQKLLEALLEFYQKKQITGAKPNPLSKYRSIYLTYLKYRKQYPKELPSLREIWNQK